MKTRDKRYEGGEHAKEKRRRTRKRIRHFDDTPRFTGYYLVLHKDRVEHHRQRVAAEEKLLRSHGINPVRLGSAKAFDDLMDERVD